MLRVTQSPNAHGRCTLTARVMQVQDGSRVGG
jgi:hypothetical protein